MFAFLLTVVVLSVLIVTGYRVNMYLYAQGAVGGSSRQTQLVEIEDEFFSVRPLRDVEMEERDYGLRYARVGLLLIALLMVVLVVGLAAAIFSVV